MKKFQQLVMAFLVGVVSFGFTACSEDNSERKISSFQRLVRQQ